MSGHTSHVTRRYDPRFTRKYFALEQRDGRWFWRVRKPSDQRDEDKNYRTRLAVAEQREQDVGKRAAKALIRNQTGTRFKRRNKHGRQ